MVVFKKVSDTRYNILVGDDVMFLTNAGQVYKENYVGKYAATFNVTYLTAEELTTIANFMKELETK